MRMGPFTKLCWWWLRWRGWAVQMNDPEFCHSIKERGGRLYDHGWQPLFSIRYGRTPVYRVGPHRYKERKA